eukprot:765574-Hanusia_phi.AAC.2
MAAPLPAPRSKIAVIQTFPWVSTRPSHTAFIPPSPLLASTSSPFRSLLLPARELQPSASCPDLLSNVFAARSRTRSDRQGISRAARRIADCEAAPGKRKREAGVGAAGEERVCCPVA